MHTTSAATASPRPTVTAGPLSTPETWIITGVLRNSTTDSRASTADAMPRISHGPSSVAALQQGPGLAGGDHRAGDEHASGAERLAEHPALLGQPDRGVDGVVETGVHHDPVGPEHAAGQLAQRLGGHRAGRG